jgi:GTPase SAR1 family protein
MARFKIVLIGNTKTGKTSWVRMMQGFNVPNVHIPTLGVDVHPIDVGGHVVDIWDTAGDNKFGGLREGYYIGADACIVFGPENQRDYWINQFKNTVGNKPIFTQDESLNDIINILVNFV